MTSYFELPPTDLLSDFDALEAALKKDAAGDRARSLNRYFARAELDSRATQLRSTDFQEKNLAALLADAFASAQRVVPAAWSKFHGRELAA